MEIFGDIDCSMSAFLTQWNDDSDFISAHTSGSTGVPKPISLLKADMRASAEATCRRFGIGADSTLALPLSVDYIAGKMMVVRVLVSGARLIIEHPSNHPFRMSMPHVIDLVAIVPSQICGLFDSPSLSQIRTVIIGGGAISPDNERLLLERHVDAYATYGMTETCSHVAIRKIGESTYNAMPGFSFDTDARGCLIIRTDVMSFGELVTNDIVSLVDSTRFRWLGRYDNVINSGGIKLFPEAIEAKISKVIDAGTAYYVTSRKSDKWGEEVVLVVEADAPVDGLAELLSGVLASYERPKAIIYENTLQRTYSGKIIRKHM